MAIKQYNDADGKYVGKFEQGKEPEGCVERLPRHYVDANGNYLGGFDGVAPPENSSEVDVAPPHGSCIWDGENWGSLPRTWEGVRDKRTALLRDSDWTVLVDSPFTAGKKTNWKDYRKTLRDITTDHATPQEALDALEALDTP